MNFSLQGNNDLSNSYTKLLSDFQKLISTSQTKSQNTGTSNLTNSSSGTLSTRAQGLLFNNSSQNTQDAQNTQSNDLSDLNSISANSNVLSGLTQVLNDLTALLNAFLLRFKSSTTSGGKTATTNTQAASGSTASSGGNRGTTTYNNNGGSSGIGSRYVSRIGSSGTRYVNRISPSYSNTTTGNSYTETSSANTATSTDSYGKKGEAINGNQEITGKEIAEQNAGWYYNWSPSANGLKTPNGAQFVPMIWGQKNMNASDLAKAASSGSKYLLTFNEPDNKNSDGCNMSVDQALADWPTLEKTANSAGMKLGAPAVADVNDGWLDQFMSKAKASGYKVDFIPLHWYGSDPNVGNDVKAFEQMVQKVHSKYPDTPLWITEMGLIQFGNGAKMTQEQNAQFLTEVSKWIDQQPYIQKYSFFSMNTQVGNTSMYDSNGNLTPVGKADRAAS